MHFTFGVSQATSRADIADSREAGISMNRISVRAGIQGFHDLCRVFEVCDMEASAARKGCCVW